MGRYIFRPKYAVTLLLACASLFTFININIASSSWSSFSRVVKLSRYATTSRDEALPPPRVVIKVLVNRRLRSLQRLCESLLAADYMEDANVWLEFHLEAGQPEAISSYVADFQWPHGPKFVRARIVHAGLIAVVVESWYPADSNEYAIILEDDIEVSPLFYRWVRMALDAYHSAGSPTNIFGISINTYLRRGTYYEQDSLSKVHQGRPFVGDNSLLSNWTALYFPGAWHRFVAHIKAQVKVGIIPKSLCLEGTTLTPDDSFSEPEAVLMQNFFEMVASAKGFYILQTAKKDNGRLLPSAAINMQIQRTAPVIHTHKTKGNWRKIHYKEKNVYPRSAQVNLKFMTIHKHYGRLQPRVEAVDDDRVHLGAHVVVVAHEVVRDEGLGLPALLPLLPPAPPVLPTISRRSWSVSTT